MDIISCHSGHHFLCQSIPGLSPNSSSRIYFVGPLQMGFRGAWGFPNILVLEMTEVLKLGIFITWNKTMGFGSDCTVWLLLVCRSYTALWKIKQQRKHLEYCWRKIRSTSDWTWVLLKITWGCQEWQNVSMYSLASYLQIAKQWPCLRSVNTSWGEGDWINTCKTAARNILGICRIKCLNQLWAALQMFKSSGADWNNQAWLFWINLNL